MSVLISGLTQSSSKNTENFSDILNHFQTIFSENNFKAQVSIVAWQPIKEKMNFPSWFRFHLTWIYSYMLFFSSSKKRFVKARSIAATCYFMIRKLIKLDAETSGRSSWEYMYLDQLLTACMRLVSGLPPKRSYCIGMSVLSFSHDNLDCESQKGVEAATVDSVVQTGIEIRGSLSVTT